MPYDIEKLTAYVLNELDDESRAAFEADMANDEALRAEVEAFRAAAQTASGAFHQDPQPALSDAQRDAIIKKAGHRAAAPAKASRFRARTWLKIAAMLVIVAAIAAHFSLGHLEMKRTQRAEDERLAKLSQMERLAEEITAQRPPKTEAAREARELFAQIPDDWVGQFVMRNNMGPESAEFIVREELDFNDPKVQERVAEYAQKAKAYEKQQAEILRERQEAHMASLEAKDMVAQQQNNVEVYQAYFDKGEAADQASIAGSRRDGLPSPSASAEPYRLREGTSEAETLMANRSNLANVAVGGEIRISGGKGGTLEAVGYLGGKGMDERGERAGGHFTDDPNKVYWPGHNTEAYDGIQDNPFLEAAGNPLSTFSIDVDTAAYSNIRRFLNQNTLPPKGAVRIEEMINYFSYAYTPPDGEVPFSANIEVAGCPWAPEHRLARIGLKGREVPEAERPATNLVFLIDVSGSMKPQNKLPLLRESLRLLAERLGENDHLAIAVYAGASGLVLPSTCGTERETILDALARLEAGGSTNGGAGIQLAYDTAIANFIPGGVNRVILATDGDFNVGTTDRGSLIEMVEEKAKSGVFLSILGFGMGNLKDSTLEQLADKGNGNYSYVDTLNEARKVLVEQMNGTLITIAKDVKIQVEFNPSQVKAYRLIGYENRKLAAEDFNDDTKDAGEIGAGHTVTALYELVPAGVPFQGPSVDPLKYQQQTAPSPASATGESFTVKIRYKQPDGDTSQKLEFPITDAHQTWAQASPDFKFAAAVASFGMLLRDSEYKGSSTFDSALELAHEGIGADAYGYRAEFLKLLAAAKALSRQ